MDTKNYIFLKKDIKELSLDKNDVGYIIVDSSNTYEIFFLRTGNRYIIEKSDVQEFNIEMTGDRCKNKVCDRCYKYLNTEQYFENNRRKKNNVITKRPSCKSCRKIKNGVSITTKERKIWNDQKPSNGALFKCPICQKTSIVGISKIVLDHNHSTGDVRGWLCESCNTGIGRFDDDIEILKHAIIWLDNTK